MFPSSAPSSLTSSDIGGNEIGHLAFLVSWSSSTLLTLELRYARFKLMVASLLVSISRRSPLCRGDCLVEDLPRNLIVLGGVVIIAARPPLSNYFTTSSILACFNIHLLHTVISNTSENYRIHESNKSMGALVVFIGFYLILVPTVIFPTIVTLHFNLSSSLTSLIHHQCTGETVTVTFHLTSHCPMVIFFTVAAKFLRTSSPQLTSSLPFASLYFAASYTTKLLLSS